MTRKITTIQYTPPVPMTVEGNPIAALEKQAQGGEYRYLLAYAHDGVIWGVVEGKQLRLSSDAFPEISPPLRAETLWEARLFGADAEWYLWKTDLGWQARQIVDRGTQDVEIFDEGYILWGTNKDGQESKNAFYLAEEIGQGIRHTPPEPLPDHHALKLQVRHYLDYDDAGVVYVKYSRLVDLIHGGTK